MGLDTDRQTEMTNRQAGYAAEQTAATDPKAKADAALAAQYCVEEKARLGGANSFPNPFNPPGQTKRP